MPLSNNRRKIQGVARRGGPGHLLGHLWGGPGTIIATFGRFCRYGRKWRNPMETGVFSMIYKGKSGTPERIRTSDLLLRRQTLYSVELLFHWLFRVMISPRATFGPPTRT